MKLNIFALLVLLLINGCDSGNVPADMATEGEEQATENVSTDDIPASKALSNWYMKTVASATLDDGRVYMHKNSGVFGELSESQEGKDRHDIAAYGTAIFQLVFPQTQWAEDNGDYFSDYRVPKTEDAKRVWTFQVKNQLDVDLKDASLKLTLEGPYYLTPTIQNGLIRYKEILSKDENKKLSITLIDVDNQMEYSYEELQTVRLSMDGLHIRTFRWVLGSVSDGDYEPLIVPTTLKTVTSLSTKQVFAEKSTLQVDDKFGLPPR